MLRRFGLQVFEEGGKLVLCLRSLPRGKRPVCPSRGLSLPRPDSFSELGRFRMGTVVDFHHWRTQRSFQRHSGRTLHKDGNLKASVKLFETIFFEYALNEDEPATRCNCGEQLLRLKNELTPNPIHRYFHGCGALHET